MQNDENNLGSENGNVSEAFLVNLTSLVVLVHISEAGHVNQETWF